jgi:hypothetical protein
MKFGRRVACATAHKNLGCDNRKTYLLHRIERGVLEQTRQGLADVDGFMEAASAQHAEWQKLHKAARVETGKMVKRVSQIDAATARFVQMLEDGSMDIDILRERLKSLQAERVILTDRVRLAEAQERVVFFEPNAVAELRGCTDKLWQNGIGGKDIDPKLLERMRQEFRAAVDHVKVYPSMKKAGPIEIETALGISGSAVSDNGQSEKPDSTISQNGAVLSLGRFMAA